MIPIRARERGTNVQLVAHEPGRKAIIDGGFGQDTGVFLISPPGLSMRSCSRWPCRFLGASGGPTGAIADALPMTPALASFAFRFSLSHLPHRPGARLRQALRITRRAHCLDPPRAPRTDRLPGFVRGKYDRDVRTPIATLWPHSPRAPPSPPGIAPVVVQSCDDVCV